MQDVVAEIIFAQALEGALGEFAAVVIVFGNGGQHAGFHRIHQVIAFLLDVFGGVQGVVQALAKLLFDLRGESVVKRQWRHHHFRGLHLVVQLANGRDDLLDLLVAKAERLSNGILGDFYRARFHHDDGFLAAATTMLIRLFF